MAHLHTPDHLWKSCFDVLSILPKQHWHRDTVKGQSRDRVCSSNSWSGPAQGSSHAQNTSSQLYMGVLTLEKVKHGNCELEPSLGYRVRPYLKKENKPGSGAHPFNPNIWEAEAGRSL